MPYLPESMPFPVPPLDARRFWDYCAERRLMFQACADCGQLRHPPTPVCPACRSGAETWIDAPAVGEVYSYTVVHHSSHESVAGALPYNVVLITFPGMAGVRLVSNLVDVAPGELAIGIAVELAWEPAGDGLWLPRFKRKL